MEYLLCLILLGVGLYAVAMKRNIFKMIIGVAVIGYAINLFIVIAGYRRDGDVPIVTHGMAPAAVVDPLAQALVLASIIVSLSLVVLLAVIAVRVYETRGTLDVEEIRKLHG